MLQTFRLERLRVFNSKYSGSCFVHQKNIWRSETFFENPFFYIFSDQFEIKDVGDNYAICFEKGKGYSVNWRTHI